MIDNLVTKVYENLKSSNEMINPDVVKLQNLNERRASGDYSPKYVEEKLRPQIDELKSKINTASEAAIIDTQMIIEQHIKELQEDDELHAEDLNDDVKLFTAGIKLNAKDLKAIIVRNKDNSTMQQIAFRYAAENNIKLEGMTYIGKAADIDACKKLSEVVERYRKWIGTEKASSILDKYFQR